MSGNNTSGRHEQAEIGIPPLMLAGMDSPSLVAAYRQTGSRKEACGSQTENDGTSSHNAPGQEPKRSLISEEQAAPALGFAFSTKKKWAILSVIFIAQLSMNFNASVYCNAVPGLMDKYDVEERFARYGQMIFLITYAFGCELWAPWSEEYGRKPALQLSLGLVNLTQILCALAPNFGAVLAGRFLGGLFSAGGSVTLGMVADMWDENHHLHAIYFVVLSSVLGSVVGPIVGGFLQEYLSVEWIFWIQCIFGFKAQMLHCFVPETRSSILKDREARRLRKTGEANVYGPNEIGEDDRLTAKQVVKTWTRPFKMFLTEPIVLFLSLLSGFSDALIFTFLESFVPVFEQWDFDTVQIGLSFLGIATGYFIAYFSVFPFIKRFTSRIEKGQVVQPEKRLTQLLFMAPLLAVGMFGFAWTGRGRPLYWALPIFFSVLIGVANFAIYGATIDYMVAAYGHYSASATGGNGFARDFLAGVSALYAGPFFHHFQKPNNLSYPSTILAVLALVLSIPIYVFYIYGPKIRARSSFACELAEEKNRAGTKPCELQEMSSRGSQCSVCGSEWVRVGDQYQLCHECSCNA